MKAKSRITLFGACLLAACLFALPAQALAEGDLVADGGSSVTSLQTQSASGTWGSATWTLQNGELVVKDGWGTNTAGNRSPWVDWAGEITSVRFSNVSAPGRINSLFQDLRELRSADLSGLKTSGTTDFHDLFLNCTKLTSVNLSGLDTSKATLLDAMFRNCSSLQSVDVSGLNTSRCIHFEGMFQGCTSLKAIDVSKFDTSNAQLMQDMFQGCTSLTSLDLSTFNTKHCTEFERMFEGCTSLKKLDLARMNTKAAAEMSNMFASCTSLEWIRIGSGFSFKGTKGAAQVYLPTVMVNGHSDWYSSTAQKWMLSSTIAETASNVYSVYAKTVVPYEKDPYPQQDTPPVATASGKWGTCDWTLDKDGVLTISSGTGARLNDEENAPWSNVAESVKSVRFDGAVQAPVVIAGLFKGLENMTSIDLSGFNTKGTEYFGHLFERCTSLASVDLSPLDTSSATNMNNFFASCSSLKSVDLLAIDTSNLKDFGEFFRDCAALESVDLSNFDTSHVEQLYDTFYGCRSLYYVDLSPLDTSNVTTMSEMFAKCTSLSTVNMKGLDLSKVTRMDGMFNGCESLAYEDFTGLDTSAVQNFRDMFNGCSSLRAFDARALNTSSATNMTYMFAGCTSLTKLDLSSFNTQHVTDMSNMFRGCEKLQSVNVSSFDTSAVTNMAEMFFACPMLVTIDLASFNTHNVVDMHGLFQWCTYTKRINMPKFDTASSSNQAGMFEGCVQLEMITVGPAFAFKGCALPEAWVNDRTDWFSTGARAWMAAGSIAANRSNVADTYQKSVATPSIPAAHESMFDDVANGQWFTAAVDFVAVKGLIRGYAGTNAFGVGDTLTRGQLAAIIWRYSDPQNAVPYEARAMGSTKNTTGLSDVKDAQWYTGAANWAVEAKVIEGYKDANGVPFAFGPNDPVTAEQFVTILSRLVGKGVPSDPAAVLGKFKDASSVSGWAKGHVAWAVQVGLMSGYDGVRLAPGEHVSRERAARILANAYQMGLM